jgi:hypothetical protein
MPMKSSEFVVGLNLIEAGVCRRLPINTAVADLGRGDQGDRPPPLKGPKFKFFYYFYRLSHRYKRIIVLSNNIITN